jgi:predicted Zn-dependent protease
VNAFALPGGYIYVTRGILAYLNSEAELAAVLGHKIGHVTARHSVQQYSAATAANVAATVGGIAAAVFLPQTGGQLAQGIQSLLGLGGNVLLSGYGRSHELEADRLGAEYLARSGYEPGAMIRLIAVLKNQELFDIEVAREEGREPRRYHGLFASHPDNDTRLQEVIDEAQQYAQPGLADDRREEFLRQTKGMAFGDSVKHGIVRENTFQHGEMGFTLSFPPEWRIQNKSQEVVATSPDGKALMALSLLDEARGSPADLARERLRLDSSVQVLSLTSNGLPAAILNSPQNGRESHSRQASFISGTRRTFSRAGVILPRRLIIIREKFPGPSKAFARFQIGRKNPSSRWRSKPSLPSRARPMAALRRSRPWEITRKITCACSMGIIQWGNRYPGKPSR